MRNEPFRAKYAAALQILTKRKLNPSDGLKKEQVVAAERRLKRKLRAALRTYCEVGGRLLINTEHNCLYSPRDLVVRDKKLVFMEENQAVVVWAMDIKELNQPDPEVFQAANENELVFGRTMFFRLDH